MEGVLSGLLGPWLLSKLPPSSPPHERCGYQSTHMQIRFLPSSQSKPMRGTRTTPKTVCQSDSRNYRCTRTTPLSEPFVLRSVTLGKRSALLKRHWRFRRTPHWRVSPARPDSVQSGSELLSDLEGMAETSPPCLHLLPFSGTLESRLVRDLHGKTSGTHICLSVCLSV